MDSPLPVFIVVSTVMMIAVLISDKRFRGELVGKPAFPVAVTCPNCGSSRYEIAWSWYTKKFLLNDDRKCCECRTVYTHPVQVWAALTLIVVGIAMIVGGFAVCGSSVNSLSRPGMLWLRGLVVLIPFGVLHMLTGYGKLQILRRWSRS